MTEATPPDEETAIEMWEREDRERAAFHRKAIRLFGIAGVVFATVWLVFHIVVSP